MIILFTVVIAACNNSQLPADKNTNTTLKNTSSDTIKKLYTPKMRVVSGVMLYEEGEENYLQEINMDEKVIETLVTDSKILYVTVRDEGTSQNSYARYLCEVISEFKADIKAVRVVKAVSSPIKTKLEKDYGVILGEASCK